MDPLKQIGNIWDGLRESFDFVSGSNDVVVVRHPNGRTLSSPFSVQTNASTVNRHLLGKMVDVFLNGRRTPLQMRIHDDGRLVFPQWDNSSTPEPDAMSSLPLKEGKNSIDFRLEEKDSHVIASTFLFLWAKSDKVVIVDIDGTITRTDAGGVVASSELGLSMGLGHSHEGVTEAMAAIESGGYRLLFLTARPITRADATRRYLNSIGKESGIGMPSGALITSALGTFNTMAAVWKDIKAYKVKQLVCIQELFDCPTTGKAACCFAGGFGNHDYDAESYKEVGTRAHRVLLIDEDSVLTISGSSTSFDGYRGLLPHIPDLFPPVAVLQWQDSNARGAAERLTESPHTRTHGFSVNKIPGAALLGEVGSKVWGNVASTTSSVGSGLGEHMNQLPGAGSLKALKVPDFPKMPPMGMPSFPGGPHQGDSDKADMPPSYSDPEVHGLIDRGE